MREKGFFEEGLARAKIRTQIDLLDYRRCNCRRGGAVVAARFRGEKEPERAAGRQLNFAYETVLKTARRGKAGASDP